MNEEPLQGGKVIASGGFGCVFDPALKCMDNKKNVSNPEKYVSKLMLKEDAEYEYNEISKIRLILKEVPNYKKYFLLDDIHICKPNKLEKDDLYNYNKKCGILKKNNISIRNINDNLSKLYTLTMPNGGINIESYIHKLNLHEITSFFHKIVPALVNLLIRGILPMNKNNIYHSDIKDTNILVDTTTDFMPRLIDWGISTIYSPFQIPSSWKNKPLIFNSPFSIILFTDIFKQDFSLFAEKHNYDILRMKPYLNRFLKEYIYKWIQIRGEGHLNYINTMMYLVFTKKHIYPIKVNKNTQKYITIPYIIKYLSNTIIKYISFNKDNELMFKDYLNIFIHNIDIWGFCSIFYPFYEIYYLNYVNLVDNQKYTYKKLKTLFIYLFTTYDKLDINKLIDMFHSLVIFEKIPRPYFILGLTKKSKKGKTTTKKNIRKT